MSVVLPRIRVGEPVGYESLTVFPLFDGAFEPVEYTLSDDGIASGSVTVEEVSAAGSVPDLLVENKGDVRVLFLEGEELIGAKQNRILNTSVLIAAQGKTKIPVSCVEQGRWSYRSRRFDHGGRHSSSKLRRVLKKGVHNSLQAKQGHRSDQWKLWHEVSRQQEDLGASSETHAMSDTYLAQEHRLAEFRERLQYVEGACGLAVAVGGKVVALDLFNRADTCRKVWQRLLSGYVLDALEEDAETAQPNAADVEQWLETVGAMPWQQSESVGEGEEYRANLGEALHASALTLGNSPVHVSVIVG
jgi:hypothetical protein